MERDQLEHLIRHGMVDIVKLTKRVELLPIGEPHKSLILATILRDEKEVGASSGSTDRY